MSDEVWRRDEIESPCIKLCVVHPASRLCLGCYRSIEEIAAWSGMTPEARRAVMAELRRAHRVSRRAAAARRRRDAVMMPWIRAALSTCDVRHEMWRRYRTYHL